MIRLALFAGLFTGLGEVGLRLLLREIRKVPVVFVDPATIWLAPLSAFLILLPCILAVWALGRLRDRSFAWACALTAAAFLVVLNVALLVPRVHVAALIILAAGAAFRLARIAGGKPRTLGHVLRVGTPALAVVAVVGGIVTTVAKATATRRALAAAPPAAADAPNVVILVLDTVRALQLSAYGYSRATSPHLATFASEGVRFDRAVATAPWTLASHASLFTGYYQRDLSVGWSTPLDAARPTLAERFSDLGYATGGFVANLVYGFHEYGLARGFQVYRDYALVWSEGVGSTAVGRHLVDLHNHLFGRYTLVGRKDAVGVVDEFLQWQRDVGDRPFFAFLNFFDAHEPYAPEAPYDRLFLPGEPPTRRIVPGLRLSPDEVRGLRDAYDGAIASADAQLGRLFAELARRGVLDRTLIVVTSDHGEEFGEHGLLSHGSGLNLPSLHVPLILRWPAGGLPAGTVVSAPVTLRDVPATILDLVHATGEEPFPGSSLVPLWKSPAGAASSSPILSELYWVRNKPAWYPLAGGNMQSLVRGRFHLIVGPAGREELYDVQHDPFEVRDVVGDETLSDTLQSLRDALAPYPMSDRGGR